ncbi:uncharacterized protein TNCV_4992951 [Trichonephila clavipes]|nr:uncharacterized protein TNCV_4992951 [Trichonephila clavipes]
MLTEKITTGESIEDCRQQCYDTKEFICRSVTFDRRFKTCGLSHHTRKSAPPESITRSDSHELLEISTCFQDNLVALHFKYDFWHRTATAGSDVVQSGRPIFDDFFQHLWPYIGNNTANVVFQMVKRLWLIRIDQ